MPVTLAQVQLNSQDDIQPGVIDEIRRSSYLLDQTPFDASVHPGGGGGSLTYGYQRVSTYGTATTRAYNAEYVAQEAQKARFTVDLKPFGGAFQIDRVLQRSAGLVDEMAFQVSQKIKALTAEWHRLFINGDEGTTATEFDGLDVALAGTDTEISATAVQDWTAVANQDTANSRLETLDEMINSLHMRPTCILTNTKGMTRMQNLARRAEYRTEAEDAFGRRAMAYDGIMIVDLGDGPDGNPIIPIETRTVATVETTGLTDIYAVHLGMDGVHGVTLADTADMVRAYLDEFDEAYRQSGAVRKGEVEMVGAVAIRHTKAAAVLRNVKVA
jgi:hypothetical protein